MFSSGVGATTFVSVASASAGLRSEILFISGAGATTADAGRSELGSRIVLLISGAGPVTGAAIAEGFNVLAFSPEISRSVIAAGITGGLGAHEIMFGNGTGCDKRKAGAVTTVWVRLSASGGTEIMVCFDGCGDPCCGVTELSLTTVSIGGRYSDALK
ncbi:MAG: hypothetical protein QOD84_3221 [Acidobacteriaceae bacterium]